MKNRELNIMKSVLLQEAAALEKLAESLDDDIIKLVETCKGCHGKIVLTGMGKSGHVAKKISATLASLGTPSFYLHPAEAAHGDLGMVEKSDVVIMISKSGETEELIQLINSFKIIGCKLIGIFCKKGSSLQRYCELTIILPIEKEACVNNLAPTTSTTATMALGDALAVALSDINDFGKQEFALFHPRGILGKKLLLTIGGIATDEFSQIAVAEDDPIKKVLWVITRNRLGAVAVTDQNGGMVGLISDGDIRRGLEKNDGIMEMYACDLMTSNPVSVREMDLAIDVFHLMQKRKISVVPIIDEDNKLIGMTSFHDIVSAGITE